MRYDIRNMNIWKEVPEKEKGQSNEYRDIRLEDLNLSVRSFNSLKRGSCSTVGDILDLMDEDGNGLRRIRNLGARSETEIKEKLESEMGGSRVNMVWRGTVEQDGTHLKYDRKTEGLDALQHFEVYSRGGEFCSCQTTEVSGREQELRVLFRDGKAYNLYPKEMTGRSLVK